MSNSSAQAVASLRARTGVSILECKKALEEAGGDEEKAIEILRSRGQAQAVKKADRDQSEGAVFIKEGNGKAALVHLKCETDFVARNEDFQKIGNELADILLSEGQAGFDSVANDKVTAAVQALGENISLGETFLAEGETIGTYVHNNNKIGVIITMKGGDATLAKDAAMHAAAMNPLYVNPEDVTDEDVQREKGIWKEQLSKEGKPAEIVEKIMAGKEKKFREENALLTQEFVKDPSKKVADHLQGASVTDYIRVSIS